MLQNTDFRFPHSALQELGEKLQKVEQEKALLHEVLRLRGDEIKQGTQKCEELRAQVQISVGSSLLSATQPRANNFGTNLTISECLFLKKAHMAAHGTFHDAAPPLSFHGELRSRPWPVLHLDPFCSQKNRPMRPMLQ